MGFLPDIDSIDFKQIYCTDEMAAIQPDRYKAAVAAFTELFDDNGAALQIYSAPGRTEIGGNHTDHQHGQVLAASINRDAIAIVRPVADNHIRLYSESNKLIEIDLDILEPVKSEEGKTHGLVRGMAAALKKAGYEIGGFEAYVTSNVLIGAGLSSSASFEVLMGAIISGLYNNGSIDAVTIAKAGQIAENTFFGKPCGLMDQMACSVGNLVYIDFADPAAPEVRKIDFDFASCGYSLCITNTHGSHSNLTDEYAAVPEEMNKVASILGAARLREVSASDILANADEIRKKAGDRALLRALHFEAETRRALDEANALEQGDLRQFLHLVGKSGDSSFKYLQNIYVSGDTAHQNVSVALCVSDMVLGDDEASRVHGGGFAGTIQAFVRNENVASYKQVMDDIFGEASCDVLSIRPFGGTRVI